MHLLFATSIVPDGNSGSGYEIGNAAMLDALRRSGARVTVLGYCWPGKKPADPEDAIVLGEIDVRTDGASALRKVGWLMRAVAANIPFSSAKVAAAPVEQIRKALREAGPFDGYIMNSVQFAGAYEGVFDDLPSIFIAHNVEHVSAMQNAEAAHTKFQRYLFRREAALLKKLEKRLCDKARFIFTVAEEDRAPLGIDSPDRSIALTLSTRATPPLPPARREVDYDAALIGTWTWQPNRIGLEWFLDEVTPHLDPDFQIRIAGFVPEDIKPSHPGVRLVGRVPDAQEFIQRAAVIPLISRAGTGVQLKTIETFELGLPSVATSSSLRAIDKIPTNCYPTDDPKTFAQALQTMARERTPDVDGRAFFASQRLALDKRVRFGLSRAGLAPDYQHSELSA
ncbi:glycosyltransferase family 4 protein [Escherichia coli]|nr:glycosyltransferase family 4 protein [Escherichia coli]